MINEHRKAKRREYNKKRQKERKELGFGNNIIFSGFEKVEGCEKHHVMKKFIISLPSFVHRKVPHGHDIINSGMEEINVIALDCLLGNF